MAGFTDDPGTWDEDEWIRRLALLPAGTDPVHAVAAINSGHFTLDENGGLVATSDKGSMIVEAFVEIDRLQAGE